MLLMGTLRWGDGKGLVKGHRSGTELSLFSAPRNASLGKACGPFSLDPEFRENFLSPVQPPLPPPRVLLDGLPNLGSGREGRTLRRVFFPLQGSSGTSLTCTWTLTTRCPQTPSKCAHQPAPSQCPTRAPGVTTYVILPGSSSTPPSMP